MLQMPAGSRLRGLFTAAIFVAGNHPVALGLDETSRRLGDEDEISSFLAPLGGSMRVLACRYEGSRLVESRALEGGVLQTASRRWECDTRARTVAQDPDALDLHLSFELAAGTAASSGVAVAFDFADWSPNHYVMVPAAVYNGNRCRIVDRGYAQGLERKFLYAPELPHMSVPIPQLSPDPGSASRLELNACNAATPAMCFFDPRKKRAFILLAEQGTRLGDSGFAVEESADRTRASFAISAPGVRARKPLFVGFAESPDRGADWRAGEKVELRLRLHSFETPDIPGLLERFMAVRKMVTGRNHPRNLIPFSQVASWMTRRIDGRWYAGPEHRFYCPENARWISFGWVGGLMNTFPMLALGDDLHLERVAETFDFAIPRAQGEAGYFHGALNHDGKVFGREGYDEFPEIALTRKSADVLFWMVKQFLLVEAQGRGAALKPAWKSSMRRLADAFVKTWRSQGEWGRMVDVHSGQVAEFNTSGGVMAIGALALASGYFGQAEYLDVAREAAAFYYMRDVVGQGQTTGGCADILQNADSETAFGFLAALMTLHEVSGEKQWLDRCRTLAHLAATWTLSYDYRLPPETELARNGARLAGAVWASTQNKHSAPGICTSSGDSLFKLYRATGERCYAELLRDIIHAHGESIRPGGFTNERLSYCDADVHSVGNRGNHVTGWCELNGFLMALEIPGIYVRSDSDRFYVFDHVEARVLKRAAGEVHLEISNPTPHDAEVAILAEDTDLAARPLGCTAFITWPRIRIPAGATRQVRIRAGG